MTHIREEEDCESAYDVLVLWLWKGIVF